MSNSVIQLEIIDQHIANIRMQDQAGKNCFSTRFVDQLIEVIQRVKKNEAIRVVILSGLPEVFCAGADLKTLKQLGEGLMKPVDIILSKMVLDFQVPVISAMEGHAVGGGLAFGLCADMVVLAEESRYGCSFLNMGFTPGMGITKLLEHYMTPAIAHEMQYTGNFKKGRELKGKTNFNHIVSKTEVWETSLQMAAAIAEKPDKALRALKRYLSIGRRQTYEETHSIESLMHDLTFDQQDILQSIEQNYVR